eukprot:TRINITY_DN7288_c3_g1_i2.p2 TRINITY_DN7288_c3_g1~~TRINITY_DN7288_c3_g1_i2.p2  ORF type:complete len:231 (-),score=-27.66 TRINITY_DN7288_c3_g1_i2:1037-1729(-)
MEVAQKQLNYQINIKLTQASLQSQDTYIPQNLQIWCNRCNNEVIKQFNSDKQLINQILTSKIFVQRERYFEVQIAILHQSFDKKILSPIRFRQRQEQHNNIEDTNINSLIVKSYVFYTKLAQFQGTNCDKYIEYLTTCLILTHKICQETNYTTYLIHTQQIYFKKYILAYTVVQLWLNETDFSQKFATTDTRSQTCPTKTLLPTKSFNLINIFYITFASTLSMQLKKGRC